MDEIFQKSGWVNPKAIASEAGPSTSQVPLSPKNENIKENKKKRKIETALDDILENMRNKQIRKEEEKKENISRLEKFMQQKKAQYEEKMTIMQQLLNIISKKKD